jgi:hypothetical protein
MSGSWFIGAGLTCGFVGAVLLFLYGVPRYGPLSSAGQSFLLLEEDDPEERSAVERADALGKLGMILIAVGFVLQFIALL